MFRHRLDATDQIGSCPFHRPSAAAARRPMPAPQRRQQAERAAAARGAGRLDL